MILGYSEDQLIGKTLPNNRNLVTKIKEALQRVAGPFSCYRGVFGLSFKIDIDTLHCP